MSPGKHASADPDGDVEGGGKSKKVARKRINQVRPDLEPHLLSEIGILNGVCVYPFDRRASTAPPRRPRCAYMACTRCADSELMIGVTV